MRNSLLKEAAEPSFVAPPQIHFSTLEPAPLETIFSTVPVRTQQPLAKEGNHLLKRAVDLFLSSILILVLFPWLLPLVALLIKLDSKGPVFFIQKRNKRDGGIFSCIKFRSMLVNKQADFLPATENDERITSVGKFLRQHHLDELPQLLNVWMGDMSMIGPRPHMISDNHRFETLVPHYHHRHKVKPGITGLAQVLGYAGPVTSVDNIRERVEKDIYYVYNWSITLDTKIACRTLLKMAGLKQNLR